MDQKGEELRERLKTYNYSNQKEELYDCICELLTSYENRDDYPTMDDLDWTDNFYKVLVHVANSWEIITGGD